MLRPIQPTTMAVPAANYAHAVEVTGAERWLHTSGVVPVRADGTTPRSVADQAAAVWDNIATLLAGAEMSVTDIVSVTTYAVAGASLGDVMAARDEFMGNHRAASTLVTVPGLARPEWLLEIAIVAAK